jgi:Uncharacterized conserved protein (COG2071)
VHARLRVRDLLIASWETGSDKLRRVLPAGLDPTAIGGRYLASLAAFRVEGGRLGRAPVLPYSQLNVRAYTTWKEEPAVFFVAARVTAGGLAGVLVGAPFRYARLRVGRGLVRARGLGVSLRYEVGETADPGLLGRHELGLFESDGLRLIRLGRAATEWRRAEVVEPARADFLVALGFEPGPEPELLYAERASFETEVPPAAA